MFGKRPRRHVPVTTRRDVTCKLSMELVEIFISLTDEIFRIDVIKRQDKVIRKQEKSEIL